MAPTMLYERQENVKHCVQFNLLCLNNTYKTLFVENLTNYRSCSIRYYDKHNSNESAYLI